MGTSCSVEVPVVHYNNPFRNRRGSSLTPRAPTPRALPAAPPAAVVPPAAVARSVASPRRKSSSSSHRVADRQGGGSDVSGMTPQEQFRHSLEIYSRVLLLHMAANSGRTAATLS